VLSTHGVEQEEEEVVGVDAVEEIVVNVIHVESSVTVAAIVAVTSRDHMAMVVVAVVVIVDMGEVEEGVGDLDLGQMNERDVLLAEDHDQDHEVDLEIDLVVIPVGIERIIVPESITPTLKSDHLLKQENNVHLLGRGDLNLVQTKGLVVALGRDQSMKMAKMMQYREMGTVIRIVTTDDYVREHLTGLNVLKNDFAKLMFMTSILSNVCSGRKYRIFTRMCVKEKVSQSTKSIIISKYPDTS